MIICSSTRSVCVACPNDEIRICTNKTCNKRQNSPQILKFAQSLQISSVQITECGCLGHCGQGPNIAIMPQGVILQGINTPERLMQVLEAYCNTHVSAADVDAATVRFRTPHTPVYTSHTHSCACRATTQHVLVASTWLSTSTPKPSCSTRPMASTCCTQIAAAHDCPWATRPVPWRTPKQRCAVRLQTFLQPSYGWCVTVLGNAQIGHYYVLSVPQAFSNATNTVIHVGGCSVCMQAV